MKTEKMKIKEVAENSPEKPKKLSKAGEWMRSGKGKDLITIVDMKALLK